MFSSFSPNEEKSEEFKELTKSLYEFGQNAAKASDSLLSFSKSSQTSFKPLKSLFVKGFDNEQIWQQLNVFNSPFIDSSVNEISSLASKRAVFTLNIETKSKSKSPVVTQEEAVKSILKASNTKEPAEKKEQQKVNGRKVKFSLSDDGDESAGDGDQERNSHQAVDFFNKDEMEAFLDAEDRKAMDDDPDKKKDDDDDDIDYFADIPSDSDEEDGENEERGMYFSFFDEPSEKALKKKKKDDIRFGSDDDDDEDEDEEGDFDDEELEEGAGDDDEEELDTRDFDDEDLADDDDDDEMSNHILGAASDSDDEEEDASANNKDDPITRKLRALANEDLNSDRLDADDLQSKSEFERSQLLLKRRIQKAERELLHPSNLHWQLAGETTGDVRPENSLLEEHLQFDHVSKPAPLITDQTTLSLEGLIKQRIKDGAFDDVERKEKPTEQPFEFRRRILLESEKSKVGLVEVYEAEYLKKQQQLKEQQEGGSLGFAAAGEQEETETRKEVRRMMRGLFRKLDALSAFHYTPRPPEAEVKIINNLPAITVEEVTPDTVSDMKLLAPEEVFSTRGKKVLQAPGERSATDRKRARRLKKKKQSVKQTMLEQKAKLKQVGKANKAEIELLKTAAKKGSKKGAAEANGGTFDKKALSSSTKFFERLQESKETGKVVKRKKALAKSSEGGSLAKKLKL